MRKQVTIRIETKILDRLKDIVYENRDCSLNDFIQDAIQNKINQYGDVDKRPCDNLRSGRKLK